MIKVELGKIIHADNVGALLKLFQSKDIPAEYRWKNRKLFSSIQEEIKIFRQLEVEVRKEHTSTEIKTVKENGEDVEKEIKVLDEEKYWEEIAPILESEVEIEHDLLQEETMSDVDLTLEEIISVEFLLE